MTVKRILSSMEASFNMEGFQFDDDCRKRAENILESRLTVAGCNFRIEPEVWSIPTR